MTFPEFQGWLREHKLRHARSEWEAFERDYRGSLGEVYASWFDLLKAHPVERAEAASRLLLREPPAKRRDPDDHPWFLERAVARLEKKDRERAAAIPIRPAEAAAPREPSAAQLEAHWRTLPDSVQERWIRLAEQAFAGLHIHRRAQWIASYARLAAFEAGQRPARREALPF